MVAILYPIPRIALFPLVLILVGLNENSNIIMIAIGPFFTMLITAMAAVMNIEPIYLDVAKNFGVKPRQLYFTVILPAVLPPLMAGVLVSLGLALLGTVAVEFLVTTEGLGYHLEFVAGALVVALHGGAGGGRAAGRRLLSADGMARALDRAVATARQAMMTRPAGGEAMGSVAAPRMKPGDLPSRKMPARSRPATCAPWHHIS